MPYFMMHAPTETVLHPVFRSAAIKNIKYRNGCFFIKSFRYGIKIFISSVYSCTAFARPAE